MKEYPVLVEHLVPGATIKEVVEIVEPNYQYKLATSPETLITFQKGNSSRNGVTNEELIIIIVDRLRGFNVGEWACRETATAITKLEEALMWLNKRTAKRVLQQKEGTNEV